MTTPTPDTTSEHELDERTVRDQEMLVNTMPSPITALDPLGVERIVTLTHDYTPPQVDPDPKEVARLAALQTRLDNKQQERLASLTTTPDGDAGAQVAADALKAQSSTGTATPSTTASTSTDTAPSKPATTTGTSGNTSGSNA